MPSPGPGDSAPTLAPERSAPHSVLAHHPRCAPPRPLPTQRTIQGALDPISECSARSSARQMRPLNDFPSANTSSAASTLFHFVSPSLRHFVSSAQRTVHHAPNASAQGIPQRIRVPFICGLRFLPSARSTTRQTCPQPPRSPASIMPDRSPRRGVPHAQAPRASLEHATRRSARCSTGTCGKAGHREPAHRDVGCGDAGRANSEGGSASRPLGAPRPASPKGESGVRLECIHRGQAGLWHRVSHKASKLGGTSSRNSRSRAGGRRASGANEGNCHGTGPQSSQ